MSQKHGWIITWVNEEFLSHDELNTAGPRNMTASKAEMLSQGTMFEMRDGDGEPYYRGFNLGKDGDNLTFAPLDHFGRPNAGCVDIRYKDASGAFRSL